MKLYDRCKQLLTTYPQLRDSDKKLMWAVWSEEGYAKEGVLHKESFYKEKCPTPESITRCRRKLQEEFPALQASPDVKAARAKIEKEKGTHIYREGEEEKPEPKGHYEYQGNVAIWIKDD